MAAKVVSFQADLARVLRVYLQRLLIIPSEAADHTLRGCC